jgi:hypothetical protein
MSRRINRERIEGCLPQSHTKVMMEIPVSTPYNNKTAPQQLPPTYQPKENINPKIASRERQKK